MDDFHLALDEIADALHGFGVPRLPRPTPRSIALQSGAVVRPAPDPPKQRPKLGQVCVCGTPFAERPSGWGAAYVRIKYLRKRDGHACGICGVQVPKKSPHGLAQTWEWGASVDHIIPQAQGGCDCAGNLRLSHRVCNNARDVHNHLTFNADKLRRAALKASGTWVA